MIHGGLRSNSKHISHKSAVEWLGGRNHGVIERHGILQQTYWGTRRWWIGDGWGETRSASELGQEMWDEGPRREFRHQARLRLREWRNENKESIVQGNETGPSRVKIKVSRGVERRKIWSGGFVFVCGGEDDCTR